MGSFCKVIGDDGQPCEAKAENRDLSLCATHNKQRIKDERPPPPPKVYKGLQSKAVLSSRSTLRLVSDRQKGQNAAIARAYKVVDARPAICVSCGATSGLTHSHVLTRGKWEAHEDNPENILRECQECHTIWEHNKPQAKLLHASWNQKIDIIKMLEPGYLRELQMKNAELWRKVK